MFFLMIRPIVFQGTKEVCQETVSSVGQVDFGTRPFAQIEMHTSTISETP